jgi:hypothetical protein
VCFAEFHGHVPLPAGDYHQDYVVRATFREGKIIHYREYWNPWQEKPSVMPKRLEIFLNTINPKAMKIAIGAAAGNVGSRTARQLSAAGIETLLIGRNGSHLSALDLPNAQIRPADMSDAQQVVKATQGADALLWLVPQTLTVPA